MCSWKAPVSIKLKCITRSDYCVLMLDECMIDLQPILLPREVMALNQHWILPKNLALPDLRYTAVWASPLGWYKGISKCEFSGHFYLCCPQRIWMSSVKLLSLRLHQWLHFQNVWKSIRNPAKVNSLCRSSDTLTAGIQYMDWNSCSKIVHCARMPHYFHLSSTEEQFMRENNLIQPKMSCLYLLIEPKAVGDVGHGGWVIVPLQNKMGLVHHGTHTLKHLLHLPALFDANCLVVGGNLRDAPVWKIWTSKYFLKNIYFFNWIVTSVHSWLYGYANTIVFSIPRQFSVLSIDCLCLYVNILK